MGSKSPDSTPVSMVITAIVTCAVYQYLGSSRRRTEPWCRGSLCGLGCCRRSARRARHRRSSFSGRWWGNGRCRQPTSRGRTGPGRPARRGRAGRRWPAGLPVSGSAWRPWPGSASPSLQSERPLLGDDEGHKRWKNTSVISLETWM